jgi:hypothetical protein
MQDNILGQAILDNPEALFLLSTEGIVVPATDVFDTVAEVTHYMEQVFLFRKEVRQLYRELVAPYGVF